MKKLILSSTQLEQAVVQVQAKESGTGFFISKGFILTARHVIGTAEVLDENPVITVIFQDDEYAAQLIADDYENDIALLKISTDVEVQPLPLTEEIPAHHETWKTYGYPAAKGTAAHIQGVVNQVDIEDAHDIELIPLLPQLKDYSGLSGSPLVIDKQVCGMIQYQKSSHLYVVSFAKAADFFKKNGIPLHELVQAAPFIPNDSVFAALESCILKQQKGFLLLSGSPGSGKSSIAYHFKPQNDKIELCGTYFVKDPNQNIPPAARSARENLLDWLEQTISKQKPAKEPISIEKRIEDISSYLQALSVEQHAKGKIGVLWIDGLDDLVGDVVSFLSVLPLLPFQNLVILFSCTQKSGLSDAIAAHIDSDRTIKVDPLKYEDCVAYIQRETKLSLYDARRLAERSEGHPLYLHYLIEYIKTQMDFPHLDFNIPQIHGDIKKYYESIWSKIKNDEDKVRIALTISQLRQPVDKSVLMDMLSDKTRYGFHSNFPKLVYLLKNEDVVSIYHSSFQEFINEKVKADIPMVHDEMARYCNKHLESLYSIGNRIFHFSHSRQPADAIEACTQVWADTCALHDIEPDLVLHDIRQTQGICIDAKQTIELIRVKLLLQRIGFRYNQVFRENAYELAEALIATKRVDAAFKYLFRENKLLVEGRSIPYLIQKIAYHHNINDAEKLYNAGHNHFSELIVKELKSETSSNLKNWDMLFDSILFLWEIDSEKANSQYMHYKSVLKRIASDSVENKSLIDDFRYRISARQAAYLLWKHDFYVTIDHLKQSYHNLGLNLDENTTKMFAQQLFYYKHYVKIVEDSQMTPKHLPQLIQDLEYLIDTCGYNQDDIRIIIIALIADSKRFDIVEKLIKANVSKIKDFSLREKDGVKADMMGIKRYFESESYLGYIDTTNQYPMIPPLKVRTYEFYTNSVQIWEFFIKSMIRKVGFLTGKAYRLKAANPLDGVPQLLAELQKVVESLSFSLFERAYFQQSYALPETILPFIYEQIIRFYIAFAPEKIPDFIKNIENRIVDHVQLGMYNEGVRKTLFNIAEALSEYDLHKKNIFNVLKILENFIGKSVLNRWERTSEWIQLMRLYGKTNLSDRAKKVYQKVLDTSMGPSWYKEDQFCLINTVLTHSHSNNTYLVHFQDFAGLLDAASGEMTFQRYIRHNQNEFVGSLVKSGHLNQAIAYYQFQLMPSAQQIIQNAESAALDAPCKGKGYIYGANALTEIEAIRELITESAEANPLIQWAFCELFILHDDIWRYISGFGALQARVLNQLWQMKSPFLEDVCMFLVKAMRVHKQEDRIIEDYQNTLSKHLDPTLRQYLKSKYAILNWREKPETKDSLSDSEQMIQKAILAIEEELEFENKTDARKIMAELLQKLRLDKKDLYWLDHWSNESAKVNPLLKKLSDSDEEVLVLIKSNLIEHYSEEWRIVNRLIDFLQYKLKPSQIDGLLNVVKDHFNYMVRPNEKAIQKYNWLRPSTEIKDIDKQLLQFLIWFLNHPYQSRRDKAMEMLTWLGCSNVKSVIESLFEACFDAQLLFSKELSAQVLSNISHKTPNLIWLAIKNHSLWKSQIVHCQHFMMKYHFKMMLKNMQSLDSEVKDLLKQLDATIPNSVKLGGNIELHEDFLEPIQDYIQAFNAKRLLNSDFCEKLFSTIKLHTHLTELEQWRAEQYLIRSFPEERFVFGTYAALLRHTFNVGINGWVCKKDFEWAVNILKFE